MAITRTATDEEIALLNEWLRLNKFETFRNYAGIVLSDLRRYDGGVDVDAIKLFLRLGLQEIAGKEFARRPIVSDRI